MTVPEQSRRERGPVWTGSPQIRGLSDSEQGLGVYYAIRMDYQGMLLFLLPMPILQGNAASMLLPPYEGNAEQTPLHLTSSIDNSSARKCPSNLPLLTCFDPQTQTPTFLTLESP